MRATPRAKTFSELDDLDGAASTYAIAWDAADPERRRSLRDDFVRRLVPFADRVASRYGDRAEPLEDVRQVARLGLMKAVARYNPARGSFTAFALVTITGEVKRHFRDRTWGVHVDRRMQDLSIEVGHATAELTHALSRAPTSPEIARHLDVDEPDVRNARLSSAGRTLMSLNMPLRGDDERELGDLIASSDADIQDLTDRLALNEVVRQLPPHIQRMLVLRFHGNLTQAQIAAEFGLSQMHVSRLLRRGLAWLRVALLSDKPPLWSRIHEYDVSSPVNVQIRRTDSSIDVEVEGEIGAHAADRLSRRLHSAVLLATTTGRLTVDLTRVPVMDAVGASVLRETTTLASQSEVTMTVVGLPPHWESAADDNPSPLTRSQPEESIE